MTSPRRQAPAGGLQADVSRILQGTSARAPAQLRNAPVLILTIGLPGSGKSTFARRLAPEVDAVILESDVLRRLLFGEPSYSPAENRRLFAALHASARELLARGRNVIIDATSIKESDRRPAFEVAEQTGARVLQIRFSAPEAVIARRLTRRSESQDPADSSSAGMRVYRRMAELIEAPKRDHWTIDTSNDAETHAALSRVVEACRSQAGRALGEMR